MIDLPRQISNVAPEKQAIRPQGFHPTGIFPELKAEDIVASWPGSDFQFQTTRLSKQPCAGAKRKDLR
jgi:hypothetical protein